MNIFRSDRRKRLARPSTLVFFSILFILMPFLNYFSLAVQHSTPVWNYRNIIGRLDYIEFFLAIIPLAVGIGLLNLKRWGIRLFFLYSFSWITHNLYTALFYRNSYNWSSLVQSVLVFAAAFYFLQKDVSVPFYRLYPRGWRGEKRKPVRIDIFLNDSLFTTKDISLSGFYVDYRDCPLELNEEVSVRIQKSAEKSVLLKGGVVRTDENGVGVAFRNLNPSSVGELDKIIKSKGVQS